MELDYKQAKSIGYGMFERKFGYALKYVIPAVGLFGILIACCIVAISTVKPDKQEYSLKVINQAIPQTLTINNGFPYIGDTALKQIDNTADNSGKVVVVVALLSMLGMMGVALWYCYDKDQFAHEYALYYIINKKLMDV